MQKTGLQLETIKTKVIDQIVEELVANKAISESDRQFKKMELEDMTKNKKMITKQREQSGLTNSSNYNQTAYELFVDISTTFKYLNELEKFINKHEELSQSSIHNLNLLISKANDELIAIEKMVYSKARPNSYVESFDDTINTSTNPIYYTDRYGEELEKHNYAVIKQSEGLLTLPYNKQINMFTYEDGKLAGTVNLSKQIAGAFSYGSNSSKNMNSITDLSHKTYWSDTLYTDEPIRVTFASIKPSNPTELEDYYYGIQHGALFELEFDFEAIARINEVDLSPYCRYPLDLIAIRYRTTDDKEEPLKEVLYPGHIDKDLNSRRLTQRLTVQFEEINCKKLYLIFNQQHYTKGIYTINQLDLFKNTLWSKVNESNEKLDNVSAELIFRPLYLEKVERNKELQFLNDVRMKDKTLDIKNVLLNKASYVKSSTKFQYQYGFYNIAANFVEFEKTGAHVSQLIEMPNNISSISLSAIENLPTHNGKHVTDIEYYASFNDGAVFNTWIPIFPTNRTWIEAEKLQMDEQYCKLRFPAAEVMYVMKNDKLLIKDIDYFLEKSDSTTDQEVVCEFINIPSFEYNDIYTVKYRPIDRCKVIDLLEDNANINASQKIDNIPARNVSYYQLTEFPIIANSEESPIKVKLINRKTGATMLDGFDIECVTNYSNPEHSYRHFTKSSLKVQYYTHKNILYFNQDISSDYDIEVSYLHYISSFRVKTILRNNSKECTWLTPAVQQIHFEMSQL